MNKIITPIAKGNTRPGEANDCVIRAASNVTGLSYDKVFSVLRSHGRVDNKGCNATIVVKAYNILGLKMIGVCGSTAAACGFSRAMETITGVKPKQWSGISLARFLQVYNTGKYVCVMRGHAFAVVDGQVIDKTNLRSNTYIAAFWKV